MPTAFDVYSAPLQGTLLIEASAGTGKTWNICGLYVRLLVEQGYRVREILVVTFTKAATAELKERIRSRLLSLERFLAVGAEAGLDDDSFEAQYLRRLGKSAERLESARMALRCAIREFDEAAIYTIHGYCQRALSELPFAAGLPFALEALESDRSFVRRSAADFYRRRIAFGEIEPDAFWHLRDRLLPDRLEQFLRQRLAKPLARMDFAQQGSMVDFRRYVALYGEAKALWCSERLAIVETLVDGLNGVNKRSYREDRVRGSMVHWDDFFSAPFAVFLDAKKDWRDKCKYLRSGHLKEQANNKAPLPEHPFFDIAENLWLLREEAKAGLQRCYLDHLQEFLDQYPAAVREAKRRQRAVGFDDMLFNLYTALREPAVPWLQDQLRERYPAALVDEFQDTDPLQLAIFKQIYSRNDRRGCLVLVGDPKQAIYRFRNADLHAYLSAVSLAGPNTWSLELNQRSVPKLLAGLNAFFSHNPQAFFLPKLNYHLLSPGTRSASHPGLIDNDGSSAVMRIWWLPSDPSGELKSKTEAEQWATQNTAEEVQRLLTEARVGEQKLRPGQIAVLVRTHRQGLLIRSALAQRSIHAVERSQASIYASAEAEEMAYLLAAVANPSRERALRAVLATNLFGLTANELMAGIDDPGWLADWGLRFASYHDLCVQHGFARLWRQIMSDSKLAGRSLSSSTGARCLTNYLHLAELLQISWDAHPSFLHLQRALLDSLANADVQNEESQVRLESDEDHVQIVTIHAAKGLEYEVVFCPYLWTTSNEQGRNGVKEYHDEEGQNVLEFGAANPNAETNQRQEVFAEDLRLSYVALTRAVQRLYIVAGFVASSRDNGVASRTSPLNWLIAGRTTTPTAWLAKQGPELPEIESQWRAWAASHADYVAICEPRLEACRTSEPCSPLVRYEAAQSERALVWSWRAVSFTSLNAVAVSTRTKAAESVVDHDQASSGTETPITEPGGEVQADDMLHFPRGRLAGVLVHAVFEHADFCSTERWGVVVEKALASHVLSAEGHEASAPQALTAMLQNCLSNVTNASLNAQGLRLLDIGVRDRINEMAFCLPIETLNTRSLYELLTRAGLNFPRLDTWTLQGYLRGAVDCIFRHAGRYYLVDWKSNHLGWAAADYGPEALPHVMAEEGYELQYALYTLAVHRYLQARVPGYRYEQHFGGCYYLFVRGMRKDWLQYEQRNGVFAARLDLDTVLAMDRLFAGAQE